MSTTKNGGLGFMRLDVYRVTREMVVMVGRLKNADRELRDQGMRAAGSVLLQLSEGLPLESQAARRKYVNEAKGSVCEVAAAVDVAAALGLSRQEDVDTILGLAARVKQMLWRLSRWRRGPRAPHRCGARRLASARSAQPPGDHHREVGQLVQHGSRPLARHLAQRDSASMAAAASPASSSTPRKRCARSAPFFGAPSATCRYADCDARRIGSTSNPYPRPTDRPSSSAPSSASSATRQASSRW